MKPCSVFIINKYLDVINNIKSDISKLGITVPIPYFDQSVLDGLCTESMSEHFKSGQVQCINDDVIVVGDIHGNLFSLMQIFVLCGPPPKTKYLFLGNFVDFGDYSLEVATLLLAFNTLFPESISLLRGVSETFGISVFKGLRSDISTNYKDSSQLYQKFVMTLTRLPIAALVYNKVFCCQPYILKKYSEINQLKEYRQINGMKQQSDENFTDFIKNFEADDVTADAHSFCVRSGIDFIIMGNCSESHCFEEFGRTYSISSCSFDNQGCIIPFILGRVSEPIVFNNIDEIPKNKAAFAQAKSNIVFVQRKHRILIPITSSKPSVIPKTKKRGNFNVISSSVDIKTFYD